MLCRSLRLPKLLPSVESVESVGLYIVQLDAGKREKLDLPTQEQILGYFPVALRAQFKFKFKRGLLCANDDWVFNDATFDFVLKKALNPTIRVYTDARHNLWLERDVFRDRALADMDTFLTRMSVQ